MVISISGAQCTGKTTLIEALKKQPCMTNAMFMGSPSRKGNDRGIKINTEATLYDQLWIATSYAKELIECVKRDPSFLISDRCLLDVLCYTEYNRDHAPVSEKHLWDEMVDTVTQLLFHLEPLYDHHIILKPEFEMVGDGVRSTDGDFQGEIASLFDKNVNMLKDFVPWRIHYLTGSVEERVAQFFKITGFYYKK